MKATMKQRCFPQHLLWLTACSALLFGLDTKQYSEILEAFQELPLAGVRPQKAWGGEARPLGQGTRYSQSFNLLFCPTMLFLTAVLTSHSHRGREVSASLRQKMVISISINRNNLSWQADTSEKFHCSIPIPLVF